MQEESPLHHNPEPVRRFPTYEIDKARVERFHSSNVRGLSKVPFAR